MKFIVFRLLPFLAGLYIILLLVITVTQRSLMYFPPVNDRLEDLGVDAQPFLHEMALPNGTGIKFIYIPPQDENLPVFVVMLGNGHNNYVRQLYAANLVHKGFGVLVVGYPGYGGNLGKPTEQNFYEAARVQINWLTNEQNIAPDRLVLFGQSIGSGVAVQMATEFPAKALILEAPFTSAVDVATWRFPIFPVRYLLWDRYDNLEKIKQVHQPTFIYQGDEDEIIPYRFGKQLFEATEASNKKSVWVEGAGHNNLLKFNPDNKSIMDHIADFVMEQNQ